MVGEFEVEAEPSSSPGPGFRTMERSCRDVWMEGFHIVPPLYILPVSICSSFTTRAMKILILLFVFQN